MKTGKAKDVFNDYRNLNMMEKIKFKRLLQRQDIIDETFIQAERFEAAATLEDAGINVEWIKEHILKM